MLFTKLIKGSLFSALESNSSIQKACLRCLSTRLAEVGLLEPPREHSRPYDTGQLFLHKIFGYRGIVLFPWLAHVYDRDVTSKTDDGPQDPKEEPKIKGKKHMYYQVLIDARDCPHIRAQTEAVTFLGNADNKALYAIPGLDYVAHEDVLPYCSSEPQPINHELFDKFLKHDVDGKIVGQESLGSWFEKEHPWLQLSDVHRETTQGIRVTIIPFYMGCRKKPYSLSPGPFPMRAGDAIESAQTQVYWWRYSVRLENLGTETVKLRERHWRIFSLSGTLETVRGRGVVGQEPYLSPEQPAFQYSSHVSLQAASGHMWGTYKMDRPDGTSFDCKIPPFSLESKSESHGEGGEDGEGDS